MQQQNLFDDSGNNSLSMPLANRLRPESLEEYIGQGHLVEDGKILRQIIERDMVCSMIFWGPPGVGKTTLAHIIANKTKSDFINFSATSSGIKEIKEVMMRAESHALMGGRTILFIDEIHRFNKAQQDAFLPFVEKGSIILIGATTENPSFEINAALLSRCKVFVLNPLGENEIIILLKNALKNPRGFGNLEIEIDDSMLAMISVFSNGDARTALNTLEIVILNGECKEGIITVTEDVIKQCLNKRSLLYDKNGEEHYNLISALHKSMRNSDPQAAVYWLARMLESGEDPLYIARRLIRFASEDVGMADSSSLNLAVSAYQACHFIGKPECNVNLTHVVIHLALAPKSNALYMAYNNAKEDALENLAEPVPLHIRNAPTNLMKDLHYGEGYQYAHDKKEKITAMSCLPENLKEKKYYNPSGQGMEEKVKERIEQIEKIRINLSN